MQDQDKQAADDTTELEIYRRVFHASPNFVSISRLSDGAFIDVHPAFERFAGRTRSEVIGRIEVESTLGKGTRFRISVPVQQSPPAP